MTITEFLNDWSPGLDEYINEQARRFSKRHEIQQDYRSEAYLYLSLAKRGLTEEELINIAYNAMLNLHRKYRREDHVSFEDYFNDSHH